MTAQEMFESLGYKKLVTFEKNIVYVKRYSAFKQFITFDLVGKTFVVATVGIEQLEVKTERAMIEELKAINKQCEELGWLDVD